MLARMRWRLKSESGFSLPELLVTMFAGIILFMATLTVLDVSMRQNARTTDRVQTTQIGRTAMERLAQELHSSCVWATVPPVQSGSTANTLWFISQFSPSTVPVPVLHKVDLNTTTHVLNDTTYALSVPNGVTDPTAWQTNPANWTLSAFNTSVATGSTNLVANVWPIGSGSVFQYYQYVTGQIATDATHQITGSPLTATTAANVGEVAVAFSVRPADQSTEADRAININDAIVVAAPTSNGAAQCQ